MIKSASKVRMMQDTLEKLRHLYNDYGCCNMALCDFDRFFLVDMRPVTTPVASGKLAKAALICTGKECVRRVEFQKVFLGFLERGLEWHLATTT
jgi:hypothetical protein